MNGLLIFNDHVEVNVPKQLEKPFHKIARDVDIGRSTRSVTLKNGKTYRLQNIKAHTHCYKCEFELTIEEKYEGVCLECAENDRLIGVPE